MTRTAVSGFRPLLWSWLLWLGLWPGASHASAEQILGHLNLAQGEWEMVGVRLYNSQESAIQDELGTFVLRNPDALRQIQHQWDFRPYYEPYCGYHYVLKFYQNKELKASVRVNLVCGYLTIGHFTYDFDPQLLRQHAQHYQQLPWSYVKYHNLENLRRHMDMVQQVPDVFVYQDVKPYYFDGFFVIKRDNFHWNVDRDSLLLALNDELQMRLGTNKFYIKPYIYRFTDDNHISIWWEVFCDAKTGQQYKRPDRLLPWRANLHGPQDFVVVTVVGVNRQRFTQIVSQ